MGVATLGPHTFRLDPHLVSWDFSISSKEIQTIGGKVVQILGARLGDMTVAGSFGVGGWQEQARFLEEMKALGADQVATQRISNSTATPTRFTYPPLGWDFLVYLTEFSQPGAGNSVGLDNKIVAPQWQLTLFIVSDNAGLRQIAADVYLSRLVEGIGWKQTPYNGPMTFADVNTAMGGKSDNEYIAERTGLAGTSAAPSAGAP